MRLNHVFNNQNGNNLNDNFNPIGYSTSPNFGNYNNPNFLRINLFNSEFFQLIEFIFYNYIYGIDKLLSNIIKSSLSDYLDTKRKIIIAFIFFLILINFLYFWLFMLIYIPRLMHFINVTRSVIKIIPTSIIMVTQDLEKWIESKYNNNFSF